MFEKNVVPYGIEKEIQKIIMSMSNKYKKPSLEDYHEYFGNYIDKISYEMMLSMRNAYLTDGIIKKHYIFKNNIGRICEDYENSNILKVSKKYDTSPALLLKMVFDNRGYSKNKIRSILLDLNFVGLSEFDKNQVRMVLDNDDFFMVDNDKVLEESLKYEMLIGEILTKNKIRYKTQNELMEEQKEKYGKSICTPDFLILDDLELYGMCIKWIDCKKYYGANVDYIKKSIKKQTKKYLDNYGCGCIVFKHGFSEKLYFEDILLLNM